MFQLSKYLSRYKKATFFAPLFKLIEAIFELIVPLVMAKIIDVGIPAGDVGYIWRLGGLMLLLGVLGLGFSLTCQYLAARASQGFGTDLRNAMFRHINTLSHTEIDRIGTPSLVTRITNDVNQLQITVSMLLRLVTRSPFLVIGATVMAFLIDWRLALIFVATVPVLAVFLYFVMSKSVPHYRRIQKKLDSISLITRENLQGNRVIRAFSKQKNEEERFHEASEELNRTSRHVAKLAAVLNPATTVIMNLAIAAIIWFGGMRANTGNLSQGEIVAMVNYMTQILIASVVLADLIVIFTKAIASGARVNEILNTQNSVAEHNAEPVAIVPDSAAISFNHVSFRYDGAKDYALKNLTVDIFPGETVGIIGGTGSGKTTLASLVPRFYDVSEGVLKIHGTDIRDYPLSQLRGQIGVVPQQAVLFSGTIAENLRWGARNATDEDLKTACQIAQAWEFVEQLPEQLNAPVLQGGKNFSGGQKQRLTIARALAMKPRILILDDSASALDFATDARLRAALKTQTADMTVLSISQRAAGIMHADKIIVLDDGEVAGIGTHEQLFAHNEIYREICLSQLSAEEAKT